MRPERPASLRGRDEELAALVNVLEPGRVAVICGPGGLGKSSLVAEVVWRLAPDAQPPEQFPNGIVTYDFREYAEVDRALEIIATAFGEEALPDPRSAARRTFGGRKALLILESTENANDLGSLLEIRDHCAVIITTRRRSDARGHWCLELPALSAAAALALLHESASGDLENDLIDDVSGGEICRIVGYLPLAVRLIGRYLVDTGEPAAEYLEALRNSPLDELDLSERQQESIPLILAETEEQLSSEAKTILLAQSWLGKAPIPLSLMATVLDLPKRRSRRALAELVDFGLLRRRTDDSPIRAFAETWEIFHALVHTYAERRRQEEEASARTLLKRLAGWFLQLARADDLDDAKRLSRLAALRPHLRLVLVHVQQAFPEEALELVLALHLYLRRRARIDEQRELLALGVELARDFGTSATEAEILCWRSETRISKGNLRLARSDLSRARELLHHREDGPLPLEIELLSQLARLDTLVSGADAKEHAVSALDLAREIEDSKSEGIARVRIGRIAWRNGIFDEAEQEAREAVRLLRDGDDRASEASALDLLAGIEESRGNLRDASSHRRTVLELYRESGDLYGEVACLIDLARMVGRQGEMGEAIELYQRIEFIEQELGAGQSLARLGQVYWQMGDTEKSLEYSRQALARARQENNAWEITQLLGDISSNLERRGELGAARKCLEEAREIASANGMISEEAWILSRLGLFSANYETASSFQSRAIELAENTGDPLAKSQCYYCAALIEETAENYQRAGSLFEQALESRRRSSDPASAAIDLAGIARCQIKLGKKEEALTTLHEALELSGGSHLSYNQIYVLKEIGRIYGDSGHYQEAADYYKTALEVGGETRNRINQTEILYLLSGVYRLSGRSKDALDHSHEAVDSAIGMAEKGRALVELGISYRSVGNGQESLRFLTQGKELFANLGYRPDLGWCFKEIGLTFEGLGRLNEALDNYSKSEKTFAETGHPFRRCNALYQIARLHRLLGLPDEALQTCERGLRLARQVGAKGPEADFLLLLGSFSQSQGAGGSQRTLQLYQQALQSYIDIGNHRGELKALGAIGDNLRSSGKLEEAVSHFDRALDLCRQLNETGSALGFLYQIAELHSRQGKHDKAIHTFEEGLELARAAGSLEFEAKFLILFGNLLSLQGASEDALNKFMKAADIYKRTSNHAGRLLTLLLIGAVLDLLQRQDEAIPYLEEALDLSVNLKTADEASVRHQLAKAHAAIGQHSEVAENLERAVEIVRTSGNQPNLAQVLVKAGEIYLSTAAYLKAEVAVREATSVAQKVENPLLENQSWYLLGNVHELRGEVQETRKIFKHAAMVAESVGDTQRCLQALSQLAGFEFGLGHMEQAALGFREAAFLAQQSENPSAPFHYALLSRAFAGSGFRDEAAQSLNTAVHLLDNSRRDVMSASVWEAWVLVQYRLGDEAAVDCGFDELNRILDRDLSPNLRTIATKHLADASYFSNRLEHAREALESLLSRPLPGQQQVELRWRLADVCLLLGHSDDYGRQRNQAEADTQKSRNLRQQAYSAIFAADLDLRLHKLGKVMENAKRAIELSRAAKIHVPLLLAYQRLANAALELEEPDQALETAKEGSDIAARVGNECALAELLRLEGCAESQKGHREHAAACLDRAIELHQTLGSRELEAQCWNDLTKLHLDLNARAQAKETVKRAIGVASEVGAWGTLSEAFALSADIAQQSGDRSRADQRYRRAIEEARRTGNQPIAWKHSWDLGLLLADSDPKQAVELMKPQVQYRREIRHARAEKDSRSLAEVAQSLEAPN